MKGICASCLQGMKAPQVASACAQHLLRALQFCFVVGFMRDQAWHEPTCLTHTWEHGL